MNLMSQTLKILAISIMFTTLNLSAQELPVITVGSKTFTESYILAEIISEIIEAAGEAKVSRRFGMGSTGILLTAIQTSTIDLYPEYSGTIAEVVLKNDSLRDLQQIRAQLNPTGLTISNSLGFNNTYALGVRSEVAQQNRLQALSDLSRFPSLRFGFSYEFLNRPDGYSSLSRFYHLQLESVRPMEHSLAYEALARNEIDGTDVYSTDAKVKKLNLSILRDDRGFFPVYDAVIFARLDFQKKFPKTWKALKENLESQISEITMREMNEKADLDKKSFHLIAQEFLGTSSPLLKQSSRHFRYLDVLERTRQHLVLVFLPLLAAIIVGVPVGILATRNRFLSQIILTFSSLVQTIPSLALLCFLIPFFGVGTPPALFALFLYALLPIVSNTYLGISTIDGSILDSAKGLGLSAFERLRLIELPLASRSILTGIRTSAVIGIGTATLAALIGAGGYGAPIVTGLALNDIPVILTGAIPAALLALITHACFYGINRWLVPKGLRLL
jgi:osmoprotectant transport system permease protein